MSLENPSVPLSAIGDEGIIADALHGGSKSSRRVTRKKALGLSSVWRGVNLIANDVGRHTFRVYRYQGDGLLDDAKHQAARVMRRPNGYMTPFTFRQTLQAHALLSGNGYAFIDRDQNARPRELLPLDPDHTWPVRVDGQLWYVAEVADPLPGKRRKNALVKIRASDVLHIKGLGFDGLCGYPVLQILAATIGGAVAARDYGGRYFDNDGSPGVVLEVPAGMKETAVNTLRRTWAEMHVGFDNAHRPAILRDGVQLKPYSKPSARDAQLLENRQFDARDLANVLGVPPHKVGDPSRTAYNSLESENQAYHEDTLGGWFVCWEQEADAKLLTEQEKEEESHCCKFDPRPLARVPLATKGTYFSLALQNGWLNVDEVRGEEGRNPLPNGLGQTYRTQVNLAPIGEAPADAATEPAAEPQPANDPNAKDKAE